MEKGKNTPNSFFFSVILTYLSSGRKIEFSYQGKEYSITNDSSGNWNFCCDTDGKLIKRICTFEDKDALLASVRMQRIEGMPLSEILIKCCMTILLSVSYSAPHWML